jgi:hypothetical protein
MKDQTINGVDTDELRAVQKDVIADLNRQRDETRSKVEAARFAGALRELAGVEGDVKPPEESKAMPYWLYRKLVNKGVDMEGVEYDITQAKEPHPEQPVRYLNRAARRAAKGRR